MKLHLSRLFELLSSSIRRRQRIRRRGAALGRLLYLLLTLLLMMLVLMMLVLMLLRPIQLNRRLYIRIPRSLGRIQGERLATHVEQALESS